MMRPTRPVRVRNRNHTTVSPPPPPSPPIFAAAVKSISPPPLSLPPSPPAPTTASSSSAPPPLSASTVAPPSYAATSPLSKSGLLAEVRPIAPTPHRSQCLVRPIRRSSLRPERPARRTMRNNVKAGAVCCSGSGIDSGRGRTEECRLPCACGYDSGPAETRWHRSWGTALDWQLCGRWRWWRCSRWWQGNDERSWRLFHLLLEGSLLIGGRLHRGSSMVGTKLYP